MKFTGRSEEPIESYSFYKDRMFTRLRMKAEAMISEIKHSSLREGDKEQLISEIQKTFLTP